MSKSLIKADTVTDKVLNFYKTLPFNITESPDAMAKEIRMLNSVNEYPPLTQILKPGARVIDIGCGAGWLSNSIAYYYKSNVLGLDINPIAITFAKDVASALKTKAEFEQTNLMTFEVERPFDIVVSIGVLHHTADCMGALRHLCLKLVRPRGFVFVGMYHSYGRRPFLEHFKKMERQGADEQIMADEFARLIKNQPIDRTHLISWFRDQVLHPHETQHTLQECVDVLRESNMEYLVSSIDDYTSLGNAELAIQHEKTLEDEGINALRQNRYFPGFFCVLARRRS
jgi:SAM-dependent methyltransferase